MGGGGFRGGAFHGGGVRSGGARHFVAPRVSRPPHISRSFSRSFARPGAHRARGGRAFTHRPSAGRAAHFASPRAVAPRAASRNAFAPRGAVNRQAINRQAINAGRQARAVRNAFSARPVSRALLQGDALRDPGFRARVTSRIATAGWGDHHHHHRWRHRHGGFGWVGPVFWPFAFYDVYDYSLWGYGYGPAFWDYGYPDIYAGIFAPYGYDDLIAYSGYLPSRGGKSTRNAYASTNPDDRLGFARMCGDDSREIAGLPIDEIQKTLELDDAQRAALDDLANASVKAAQDIKASCPSEVALTAPRRIALMQQRIEAMVAAVALVQPPLDKFYGLLNDEQKARFNALAAKSQRPARGGRTARTTSASCGAVQPGLTDWPSAAIEQSVRPNEDQRRALDALRNAADDAANMLSEACEPEQALTPPARLAAVGKRLDAMLQAVKTVRAALDTFYGTLSDEQKAAFDVIGTRRKTATRR
jgi:hypothetical protein